MRSNRLAAVQIASFASAALPLVVLPDLDVEHGRYARFTGLYA